MILLMGILIKISFHILREAISWGCPCCSTKAHWRKTTLPTIFA